MTAATRQGRVAGPGRVQWERLFALEPGPSLPLQTRLRQAIVQALLDGRLDAGAAMPSSRELARLLGLSRNTVTAAYEQLVDEGFLPLDKKGRPQKPGSWQPAASWAKDPGVWTFDYCR